MLYRPLFWTAFWCEDWLNAFGHRGADHFLISSASAKTAFCLAYLLRKRRDQQPHTAFKIFGLTSKRNVAFTKGLKLYDNTFDYGEFESGISPKVGKWLYIDVAGNDMLNSRVQIHLAAGGALVACVQLGLTNLSPSAPSASSTKFTTNTSLSDAIISSSQVEMEDFFMPEWLTVRQKQLSITQIISMQAKVWRELMQDGKDWVRIERLYGGPSVERAYQEVAHMGTDPTTGSIWSLWDNPDPSQNALSKL